MQAKDIEGDSWGTSVTAEAESNAASCAMLTIEGKPVISYVSSGNLKIVQALDADGKSWGDALIVEGKTNTSEVVGAPSLAVVNGKPAISYLESTFGISQNLILYDLKYVQSLDTGATHWDAPVIIDTAETIQAGPGIWTSGYVSGINLNVVDGRPVVAYTHSAGDYTDVRYVRAGDADGKTWAVPGVAAPDTNPVAAVALSIVNGSPAISFMDSIDNTHGNLRYVQAKDTAGSEWEMPVLLDGAAKWGGISMAVIHSKPAISYHSSLRYIAAGPVNLYLPLCRK